jgi:SpoVK/Ycf46/Vps4 family AAA+-type ATPase
LKAILNYLIESYCKILVVLTEQYLSQTEKLQSQFHGILVNIKAMLPLEPLKTDCQWADLVLNETACQQLNELKECVKSHQHCHALFYGHAGTGKRFAGALLGKELGKEVMRIDLSAMFSKYIGETEKNLTKLFDMAEQQEWILFFDEADALFGKRSEVKDAHDRYANQEVSYLLQRIEDHSGLLILASNRKENIDDAFVRRFHYVIHFPIPEAPERLRLWEKVVSSKLQAQVNLHSIARECELSAAEIVVAGKELSNETGILQTEEVLQKIRDSVKNFRSVQ